MGPRRAVRARIRAPRFSFFCHRGRRRGHIREQNQNSSLPLPPRMLPMLCGMLRTCTAWLPLLLFFSAPAQAIVLAPLTEQGTYRRGFGEPSSFQIGSGGLVEELEAFVRVDGAPAAAILSTDPVPAGLALAFQAILSDDGSDLLLRYELTNTGSESITGLTFVSFLDVEIDEAINTFFNEYGEVEGVPAPGQGFEIDEPG